VTLSYIQLKVAADSTAVMRSILRDIVAKEPSIDTAHALIERDPTMTWSTDLSEYLADVDSVRQGVDFFRDYLAELRKIYNDNSFRRA